MSLEPGTVLAGIYRTESRLGSGGMGEVWAGVRLRDGSPVALKVLQRAKKLPGEVLARFKREAKVLARVRSDYVSRVLDFVADRHFGLVLVMELIPGESLQSLLARTPRLPVETVLSLCADISRGLCDLHACNVVHRDLKPGNIILSPLDGFQSRAMLIDFGVSRIMSGPDEEDEVTAITRADRVLGTLEYMSPEQILGSRTVTGSTDIYAVGAIMFRAIAGHHVYGDESDARLASSKLNVDPHPLVTGRSDWIGTRTEALVARLLSRHTRERPATAEDLLAEIEAIRGRRWPHDVPDEEMETVAVPARSIEGFRMPLQSQDTVTQPLARPDVRPRPKLLSTQVPTLPPSNFGPRATDELGVHQELGGERRLLPFFLAMMSVILAASGLAAVSYSKHGVAYRAAIRFREQRAKVTWLGGTEPPPPTSNVVHVEPTTRPVFSAAGPTTRPVLSAMLPSPIASSAYSATSPQFKVVPDGPDGGK